MSAATASAAPSAAEQTALGEIARLLGAGYASQAADEARRLIATNPGLSAAHGQFGAALRKLGQHVMAEAAMREALRLDGANAAAAVALGDLLTDLGRPEEGWAVLAPLAERPDADIFLLSAAGGALKAMGALEAAASVYERARAVAPASGVAEHNLAGVLGDMHRFAESEAAASRAFAKGLNAPETWLVRGRALQGLGRYDEAASAFEEAARRRPGYPDALGDLAQLIWMRTEDASAAAWPLDQAIAAQPKVMDLRLKKARLLEFAGRPAEAYAALSASSPDGIAHPAIQVMAAHLASAFDPPAALAHAQRAYAMARNFAPVVSALAEAQLAAGDPAAAAETAAIMRSRWPNDQHGIGLLATAWRMLDDPRYRELYDYARSVRTWRLEPPTGWSRLDNWLADLGAALGDLHTLRTHPVGQSLRQGTQTQQSLLQAEHPAIRGFFQAVDAPIREHIAWLGAGTDPLRSRRAAGYRFAGVWSVRLRPGGYHASHLHQQGWLSSACYIALPPAIENGREGWLTFGAPGTPASPPLEAEHFIKPEPGLLALFPSYMWHGTAPFGGEAPRLTIAFDLLPDDG